MGYVAAAMAVFSAYQSFTKGKEAKEDAEIAGNIEASIEGHLTEAKVTALSREQRAMRGQTIAGAAGSNVITNVGSPLQVLTEQARTFGDEKRITRQAGASRAALANTRANMVGQQAYNAGLSSAMASASSAFSLFASARQPAGS